MTRARRQISIGCLLLMAFIVIVAFNVFWSNTHDRELNLAMQKYRDCVIRTYHMTPIKWYEQHQQYPDCDPKPL